MQEPLINDSDFRKVVEVVKKDFFRVLNELSDISFEIKETSHTPYTGALVDSILYVEEMDSRVTINRVTLGVQITPPKGLSKKLKRKLKSNMKGWSPRDSILNLAKSKEGFEQWLDLFGKEKYEQRAVYQEGHSPKPRMGILGYFLDPEEGKRDDEEYEKQLK